MQIFQQQLLDSLPCPIWSIDDNYEIVSCNAQFKELMWEDFGLKLEVGKTILPDELGEKQKYIEYWAHQYEKCLAGNNYTARISYKTWRGQQKKTMEVMFSPIKNAQQQTIGVACYAKDVSEDVKTAEIYAYTQSQLSITQQVAQIGGWEMDLNTCILSMSKEKQMLMGWKPPYKEFAEITLADFATTYVHVEDRQLIAHHLQLAMQNKNKVGYTDEWEFRLLSQDGKIKHIQERSIVLEKEILHGVCQDITEQKSIESQHVQLSRDLVHHNRHLEQFTYIVSHNLRAPISRIMAISEFMHHSLGGNKELSAYATMLRGEAERLDEMMYDLNEILALEKSEERQEKILLSNSIHQVVMQLATEIQKSQTKILIDIEEDWRVLAHVSFLSSIFHNLITNAIKFRDVDRALVIEITAKKQDNYLVVSISDNGMGMDMEKIKEKLFGIYQRFHPKIEGKGMGLFMSKTQMELMKGKIEVESELGKGTTFHLYFQQPMTAPQSVELFSINSRNLANLA